MMTMVIPWCFPLVAVQLVRWQALSRDKAWAILRLAIRGQLIELGQVTADPSIVVQALFRQDDNGAYYEAAVPSDSGSNEFLIPFDATTFAAAGVPFYTGFAIANMDQTPASHHMHRALFQRQCYIQRRAGSPTKSFRP